MRTLLLSLLFTSAIASAQQFDVVVYGATPAGIAASLAAAEDGEKVLLVEPTGRIGGMMTNGVSHADFRTYASLSGLYREFTRRVEAHYRKEFGDKATALCARGTLAEPKVYLSVFEEMLKAQPLVTVQLNWTLEGAECSSEAAGDRAGPMRTLEVALFADEQLERHAVPARYFIDATYEGDLLAAAGAPYRVGREAASAEGESLAPQAADQALQGYNFRFCMTRDPKNRIEPKAPADYQRDDFVGVVPLIDQGAIRSVFGQGLDSIFMLRGAPLPHGKFDIDDLPGGRVRLALPGQSEAWADGSGGVAIRDGATNAIDRPPFSRLALARSRQGIADAHQAWAVGLLYFLRTDLSVPERFRQEAAEWGWCRDEWKENGHFPEQLYVREARRLEGEYLVTQHDLEPALNEERAPFHRDSVAIGDYGACSWAAARLGAAIGGQQTGEFVARGVPCQIPFGALVPKQMDNLLVVCALSATHVGFCGVRYEPVWVELGQAAGYATHLARQTYAPVQKLAVDRLQRRLHQAHAATLYFSDLDSEHPLFAAVQWWGACGGFRGLKNSPSVTGARFPLRPEETYAGHFAELDRPLDADLAGRWAALAREYGLAEEQIPKSESASTRGEWIKVAWSALQAP